MSSSSHFYLLYQFKATYSPSSILRDLVIPHSQTKYGSYPLADPCQCSASTSYLHYYEVLGNGDTTRSYCHDLVLLIFSVQHSAISKVECFRYFQYFATSTNMNPRALLASFLLLPLFSTGLLTPRML